MDNVTPTPTIDAPPAAPATTTHVRTRTRAPSLAADLCELAKLRLNFLVLVTTAVGYYMATRTGLGLAHLLHTLAGTALTAAAASALNQFIERGHDALMPRTRNRPLPAGRLRPRDALLFALAIGALGVAQLAIFVNLLTAALGLFTVLSYAFIYTPLKRVTSLNTLVGAVPGAIPPVMGFTAADGAFSPAALAVFAILFLWQMPHFLAIATLYRADYAAGGFKMLPVIDDERLSLTRRQIVIYALCLLPATLLPVGLGMAGAVYCCAATLLGLAFLGFAINAAATGSRGDARALFLSSVLYLPVLLGVMMADKL